MSRLTLHLLGSFEALLDDKPITAFRSNKERVLLAYLAVEADKPHHRDVLTELFWPERPPGTGRTNLRQSLYGLRRALNDKDSPNPFLHVTPQTIQFNLASERRLDITAFHDFTQAFQLSPTELFPDDVQKIKQAVDLYRGDFLEGIHVDSSADFQEWVVFQRERLFRQQAKALQFLAAHFEQQENSELALQYAHKWARLAPLQENAQRQLMALLAISGRFDEAIQQYQTYSRILADELGVEPEVETTAIYEQIRAKGRGSATGQVKPLTLDENPIPPHNIPTQLTPFMGRASELSFVARHLGDSGCHLFTVVGPGGIGKTRLAIQAARQALTAPAITFSDGVWIISLENVHSEESLAAAIAQTLDISFDEQSHPKERLLDHLKWQKSLLLLDNFEHMIGKDKLLLEIIESAPGVKLLVTSRERLNYQAEFLLPLEGLQYPSEYQDDLEQSLDFAAIQLFTERASRVRGSFTPSEKTIHHIIRICQLVDGLPLGIELAAAQTGSFFCERIAQGIEHSLDLLHTSWRDTSARHHSLEATFEHSWGLLSDTERAIYRKLSIFQSGFSQEAAQQVARASHPLLSALINKSMLRCDFSKWYSLHPLLHQYAKQKLSQAPEEAQQTQAKHGRYFTSFLDQREADIKGKRQKEALDEIAKEFDDIHAAWNWAVTHRKDDLLSTALECLFSFCDSRSRLKDGERFMMQVVETFQGEKPLLRGRALARQGWFCTRLGQYEQAKVQFMQSLTIIEEQNNIWELVFPFFGLGFLSLWLSEYQQAQTYLQRSIASAETSGNSWGEAWARQILNEVIFETKRTDDPEKLFRDNFARFESLGDRRGIIRAVMHLGNIAFMKEEYDKAQEYFESSLDHALAVGERWGAAGSYHKLGQIARARGNYPQAQQILQDGLSLLKKVGDPRRTGFILRELGGVARAQGKHQASWNYYREALQIARKIGTGGLTLETLTGVANLLADTGELERGVALLTLALTHPASEQLTQNRAVQSLHKLQKHVPQEIITRGQEKGHKQSLEETIVGILEE